MSVFCSRLCQCDLARLLPCVSASTTIKSIFEKPFPVASNMFWIQLMILMMKDATSH
ncbi:hypothetical protein N325_10183 [Colius striatus]|uniref:Uncharacterized protein n=1 Tax=Colius striatus TaxID=57412 RepID=A0A091JZP5_COLST|nr:hypothetical protein N325_10183 [Colius striatus]